MVRAGKPWPGTLRPSRRRNRPLHRSPPRASMAKWALPSSARHAHHPSPSGSTYGPCTPCWLLFRSPLCAGARPYRENHARPLGKRRSRPQARRGPVTPSSPQRPGRALKPAEARSRPYDRFRASLSTSIHLQTPSRRESKPNHQPTTAPGQALAQHVAAAVETSGPLHKRSITQYRLGRYFSLSGQKAGPANCLPVGGTAESGRSAQIVIRLGKAWSGRRNAHFDAQESPPRHPVHAASPARHPPAHMKIPRHAYRLT
jgi:hypothetical protein